MKNKLEQKEKKNLDELKHQIVNIWCTEITPEYCRALARSMPSRCAAVIKAQGGATKY